MAAVAALAKAKLPQAVNGRVERAVKLVLAHDVTTMADGSTEVGSSTDPLKVYHLVGAACDCQDFTHGKAPDGWCTHRIAAGIAKRVQALLPTLPVEPWPDNDAEEVAPPVETAPAPASPAVLSEAPASVNVRLTIDGREVQLTLRDTDEARLCSSASRPCWRSTPPRRLPAPQRPPRGRTRRRSASTTGP